MLTTLKTDRGYSVYCVGERCYIIARIHPQTGKYIVQLNNKHKKRSGKTGAQAVNIETLVSVTHTYSCRQSANVALYSGKYGNVVDGKKVAMKKHFNLED